MTSVLDELAGIDELALLAAAPSLTDEMASRAFAEFHFSRKIIDALNSLGFIVSAGSEFRLSEELRAKIISRQSGGSLWKQANTHFYARASEAQYGESLPEYLVTGPGLAYHGLEVNTEIGEQAYRDVAHIDSLRVSLEARRLGFEQASRGLIHFESVGLLFLQGMTIYRLGSRTEAIGVLRRVAHAHEDSREVAVAQHLVGYWDCMSRGGIGGTKSAQELLRASHKSAAKRQDQWHLAHVKHSMALCMLKSKPQERRGPIQLLRASLELTREIGDRFGEAKVLHSLGQALARDPGSKKEARLLMNQSLSLGVELGYIRHQALVLQSLVKIEDRPARRADLERRLRRLEASLPIREGAC
ncbi:hypothetical protein ET989_00015 [Propioniciclava sinopodophylli]|uniref:Tetratricopeptide repeat protein n=1 Tax=Propioniciclava sinopodophylli TaxID=1837344 RepID=A0A4Q9KGC5_9ACTN|nr:hypothetical protein [Propioniciclava sinopodophylli]TBT88390.1 hypothetical protein ET989_00015 [Propioniciclava sinopodophylli]